MSQILYLLREAEAIANPPVRIASNAMIPASTTRPAATEIANAISSSANVATRGHGT